MIPLPSKINHKKISRTNKENFLSIEIFISFIKKIKLKDASFCNNPCL